MYVMGGCTNNCNDLNSVYFSNDLADPTKQPSSMPTNNPTVIPTSSPSNLPSISPTYEPSSDPTSTPSNNPSQSPSGHPSMEPSGEPTSPPSGDPTPSPSNNPTQNPVIAPTAPSIEPTSAPVDPPTVDLGSSNTGDSDGDDGFSLSDDAIVVIIVALIFACLFGMFCCLGFFYMQKKNEQNLKLALQQHAQVQQAHLTKVVSTSSVANGGTGNLHSPISTVITGFPATGANMYGINSNSGAGDGGGTGAEDIPLEDFAKAVELVQSDMHNKGNNNDNVDGLPGQPQPNVNLKLMGTNQMNLGENIDDDDVNPGNGEMIEGGNGGDGNIAGIAGAAGVGGVVNIRHMGGLQGTGNIQKADWTKWDDGDVLRWLTVELKTSGFKDETINIFLNQFKKLNMTGVLLNGWLIQANGNAMILTQKFQNKLPFSKESMVWDVVIQAMISLKN